MATRWRMPPENWCGYAFRRSSGDGMPTWPSTSRARARATSSPHLRVVRLDGLDHLGVDAQHRVERHQRILEYHGDVVAAQVSHTFLVELQQVLTL